MIPWLLVLLIPSAPAPERLLVVTEPTVLDVLEERGLSLSTLLGATGAHSTADMGKATGWPIVAGVISKDLDAITRSDPKAGVGVRLPHRLFDKAWLMNPKTRFELVAVVNRLDRQAFNPAMCGETRLIYRLAYEKTVGGVQIHSRLPMTVNLVFWQAAGPGQQDCAAAAARWYVMHEDRRGLALASFLTSTEGPLGPGSLERKGLKSLETNLQTVRWPSTVHPSLGGHAEYVLRVFTPTKGGFTSARLENTPDVSRLKSKPALKRELKAWIRNPKNMKAIDAGVAVIPDKFLGRRSISVTPRGLARLANRPFRQLFREKDFADLDFGNGRFVKSPKALLRRLDTQTCAGCHQSRSVAGFHVLGKDRKTMVVDALALGFSDHFHGDLSRRRAFLDATINRQGLDHGRGLSERLETEGIYGSRCGLGDPGFASWNCKAGLHCRKLDDGELGYCLPKRRSQVGDACEVGRLFTKAEGHRDRVREVAQWGCADGQRCEANAVGFPNGMCAGSCDYGGSEATCGAIALLTPFNRCIGKRKPFTQCIQENVRPAALRKCSRRHPCRDDYVCARTPSGEGACLPPYFLFQLRVDGH